MLLCLQNVCSREEVEQLRTLAAESGYADGRRTAGWAAREVKRNEQVEAGPRIDTIRNLVRRALMRNTLFGGFAQPKSITRMLVSRYGPGMEYGLHVDDALMGGRRADLSFTLFLSEPDSYEGGELVMETVDGETEIKLAPGEAVVYPTSALHRVAPVTAGERLAVVGWVRSLVRRADRREILFDLDRACRSLFEREGKTPELDLLLKSKSNLLRQWAED
jgi:PKHD-type hydroxylase